MTAKLKNIGFYGFHVLMGAFAVILIATAVFPPARAFGPPQIDTPTQVEIHELGRRVETIEALNLDHRLTVIETLLNDLNNKQWSHWATSAGTGLLILERLVRALQMKEKRL